MKGKILNIALIGMPACGKTTVAIELSKIIKNYNLVDTDEKIVQNEKCSINKIFDIYGEEHFRNIETKVLKEVLKSDNQIISTGGGIVKSEENIQILKDNSIVIYLKTDIETLEKRATINNERPLLKEKNLRKKLENLLKERENNYKKAHYIVDTKGQSVEETAKEVMKKINENGGS